MTDIMRDAVENVSWFEPSRLEYQVSAGKTGTSDRLIDTWFCGFTPYYTGAIWYGYDNNNGRRTSVPDVDHYNGLGIWKDVMEQIHSDKEPMEFERPQNVVSRTVCADTGLLSSPYCTSTSTELFDRTKPNFPNSTCTLHKAPTPTPTPTPEIPAPIVPTPTPTVEPTPAAPEPTPEG